MSDDICDKCGQRIQQAHKESMDKMKLLLLKAAAQHVIETGVNDFKKSDLNLQEIAQSAYGNFGKLRYHGLITPIRHNDQRVKGRWLITRNGWAFLRGDINIPKFVKVRNNTIIEHSPVRISVRDVYYGSMAIETRFEYFHHETGEMIGFRPAPNRPIEQPALF
jgi:hypothetical protein